MLTKPVKFKSTNGRYTINRYFSCHNQSEWDFPQLYLTTLAEHLEPFEHFEGYEHFEYKLSNLGGIEKYLHCNLFF